MNEIIEIENEFDYRDKKIGCPQSAGINSAYVLVWLANYEFKPKDVYIFYAHFEEHSPESLKFVLDLVEYAKKHFENVVFEYTENSILDYFEKEKMIPHPVIAPCTLNLKIIPANNFLQKHNCTIDLVGYVRNEKRRINNMQKKGAENKHFPISHVTDEFCFQEVKKAIGWYPKIYDIRWNDKGFVEFVKLNLNRFDAETQKRMIKKFGTEKRVFKHNNCLPCKNMNLDDILCVEYFYPEFHNKAIQLSLKLQKYWGRNKDNYVDAFMTTFGREDWEIEQSCKVCQF